MEAREIRRDELDQLLEFYDLHLWDVKDDPLPDRNIVEDTWDAIIESHNHAALGVFDKGGLMASCSIAVIPNLTRGCRPYALIEHIATHRQNRRKGYASAMLEFASDYARERGCYKVMFMTGHLSEKIKKFCHSVGFESGVKNAYIKRWK